MHRLFFCGAQRQVRQALGKITPSAWKTHSKRLEGFVQALGFFLKAHRELRPFAKICC